MSSDERPAGTDDGRITYLLQLRVAHPLHHHDHALAFINSLDTLHRHFMISLQEFSDSSISRILFRSTGFFPCDGCGVPSSGPSFHCLACPFSLDAACANLPLIAVDHHPHPLLLLNRKPDHKHLICALCDEGISFPTFTRCVHCDAFLHVQCALPPAIKVKHHPHHPIVLSSPDQLVGGDSWPVFCSVCEEERDSISWVYSCAICRFVAHIGCVIYEYEVPSEAEAEALSIITSQLRMLALDENEAADHEDDQDQKGEEEERSCHEISKIKPGVTLQQILDSFSEAEEVEFQNLVTAMVQDAGGDEDDDEDETETNSEDKYLNHFSYLEKPLYDLLDRLDLGEDADNPFEGLDMDSRTLLVGPYLASEKMAETFSRVFAKHGDIAGTSNLSAKVKTIVWNLFCKVVDDMSRTEFENVSGKILVSWMIGIRTIQLAGFEVGFAFDRWKKTAMAFFGVQGKEIADDLVAEMEGKIDEQRRKLEKLCGEREKLVSLTGECLREAPAMEGKIAGDGLI